MCVSVCASILAADIAKARHILHTFAIRAGTRVCGRQGWAYVRESLRVCGM